MAAPPKTVGVVASTRRLKPVFPNTEAHIITVSADEDEYAVFLNTLKFALNENHVPTAQQIQILLYLVCYGPPPPTRAIHAHNKPKNDSSKTHATAPDATGKQGKGSGAAPDAAEDRPESVELSPEYIARISKLALDVLDNVLTLHSARDIGRLIPHITHIAEPAKSTSLPLRLRLSPSKSASTSTRGGRGGRGGSARGGRTSRLSRGGQRDSSGDSASASPEKETYASELLGDSTTSYAIAAAANGSLSAFDGDEDEDSASSARRHGSGAGRNRGRGRGRGNGRAAPAPDILLPGQDLQARARAQLRAKRKRKTGLLTEEDFAEDSDGEGDHGDRLDDDRGADDSIKAGSSALPEWIRWKGSGGSKLQRQTYRAMRALVGNGQGGRGGLGVWPLLWAKPPGHQDAKDGKSASAGASLPAAAQSHTGEAGKACRTDIERPDSPLSSASDLSDASEDEAEDGRNAARGDYGLSPGGWKLLGWLVDLWEKDAKEHAKEIGASYGNVGVTDKAFYGKHSPLFLQQLPKYSTMQLSDAASIKQVVRAAYDAEQDCVAGYDLTSNGATMRRQVAGRLLNMTALPTPISAPAFHPNTFILDFLALIRPLSSTLAISLLDSLHGVAWNVKAHLLCVTVEDLAGVRSERNAQRKQGRRKDFAPRSKMSGAIDVFAPPNLVYLRDLLTLTLPANESSAQLDATQSRSKLAGIKVQLLTILLANKATYLASYNHQIEPVATAPSGPPRPPAFNKPISRTALTNQIGSVIVRLPQLRPILQRYNDGSATEAEKALLQRVFDKAERYGADTVTAADVHESHSGQKHGDGSVQGASSDSTEDGVNLELGEQWGQALLNSCSGPGGADKQAMGKARMLVQLMRLLVTP